MRLSNHTIVVDDYPEKGSYLLYNTRTQALVKIDAALKAAIEQEAVGQPVEAVHHQNLTRLHAMGILMESEEEEQEHLRRFLHQLKFHLNPGMFMATILTTYACNFKCVYCFEESSRQNEKMTTATADQAMRWIRNRVEREGHREVCLIFYGGEPLTNRPLLEYVAERMQAWCASTGRRFRFILQTNGYLLTRACVESLLPLGLTNVRISVDGCAEVHDKNRPLRGGGGTFDRIIANIKANVDRVRIGISSGYERGEVGHIRDLVDYLDKEGILPKLDRFVFSPIHPTLGPDGQETNVRLPECARNCQDEYLIRSARAINTLKDQKNIPMKNGLAIAACPLTREFGSVTIDQQGRIYKCNSMLGHEKLALGDVWSDEPNDRHREFRDLDVWRQCPQDCAYLPMCSGGCRLISFLETGHFTTPGCRKAYLRRMLPEFIKREYDKTRASQN